MASPRNRMQTISGSQLVADLSIRLEAGLHLTAMIDPLADNGIVPAFFNESPHLQYRMLFLRTPLEHVLVVSPYLVAIESTEDAFFRHLLEHPGGWGFFAVSSLSLNETTAHWKSLLQIYSDNEVTHFRFYDSQILGSLCPVFGNADAASVLGPHSCLYLPVAGSPSGDAEEEGGTWAKVSHPSTDDPKMTAGSYELRESPWWHLTTGHWGAFADKIPGIMANNIMEFLFETYPSQAGAQHAKTGLGEFCLSHVRRAERFGITDEETAKYFVACCLVYGEEFPEGSNVTIPSAPDRKSFLAGELRDLCEKEVRHE